MANPSNGSRCGVIYLKKTHKCHPYSDAQGNVSVAPALISPVNMTMNITAQTKLVDWQADMARASL